GGMTRVAPGERLPVATFRRLSHETRVRRELVIEAHAAHLPRLVAVQLDIEAGIWRVPHARRRLPLVLIEHKEVEAILEDRTAKRRCDLLVVNRHHAVE